MRNRKYLIIAAGIILILLLSAFSKAGGGPTTETPRTISVTGNGKTILTPDIATINIGVHTENADVSAALTENNAKAQAVRDALVGFGVKPEDIQTTNFSIYPNQQYGPQGELLGIKYSVDNSVYITVRDLAKLGDVLTTTISSGANNIYGITFDVADREKALSEARLVAVADAKTQADELAAAAGLKVGKVMNLSVNATSPTPMYASNGMGGGGGAMAAAPAPISSGQLVVTVDAYVTYEIQ